MKEETLQNAKSVHAGKESDEEDGWMEMKRRSSCMQEQREEEEVLGDIIRQNHALLPSCD